MITKVETAEKAKIEEAKTEENKLKEEKEDGKEKSRDETIIDVCEGAFSDAEYPTPPVLESQIPMDHPRVEEQEEPEDEWKCHTCDNSPCLFLQWQEELERIVDVMHPEVTNNVKRYHMYRHMSRRLHGTLGKGNRRPLPKCFSEGVKQLYPSDFYTGYKPNLFESGPCGDYDWEKDDGSTYN